MAWARSTPKGQGPHSLRAPTAPNTLSLTIASRWVVTRNAGLRMTDLIQDVLKQSHKRGLNTRCERIAAPAAVEQSHKRGLKHIMTLTLPLGQGHLYEVIDVRYG